MLVLLLSGCSMIAGGKASLGGESTSVPSSSKASAPSTVHASGSPDVGDTPDEIENPRKQTLEKLAKRIEAGEMAMYALESRREHAKLAFMEDRWREPSQDALVAKRLAVLDAIAFRKYPRVAANVGDGVRVREADEDAIEAAKKMVAACQSVASIRGSRDMGKELADKTAAYEKEIARVQKLDPNAFRYLGKSVDIPADMLSCEHGIAETSGYAEDRYIPETAESAPLEKRCAAVDFLIDGVQLGGGRFAAYTRTVGGRQAMEEMDCKKLAKQNKFPKAMTAAVKEVAEEVGLKLSEMTVVAKGAPYIEADDDDGRLHRYQIVTVYSKNFQIAGNPCGKGKVFCEAGGSRGATAFNMVEFAFERAAAHAGKDPDKCKKFLGEAKQQAEWFAKFREDAIKSKSWIAGATYKTKKGVKLPETEFVSAFAKKGKDAEEMLDNKYCRKPAK
ncbi:MAG: hypothetical protein H0T89_36255 [Deltaproteobacteria bacterium]|nr:hypothetical protein [Deltaproteobacteria bacterium]MDQ3298261.1 hypothetical protein [Myxococcota bacterium]